MKVVSVNGVLKCLFKSDDKGCVIDWIDSLLECVDGFKLTDKLIKIQEDVLKSGNNESFQNVYRFPVSVLNIILEKFNLMIVEDEYER